MPSREELEKQLSTVLHSVKPTIFVELLPPNGVLHEHPACHALWQYAYFVHKRIDDKDGPQYEDDPIDLMRVNELKQTFTSLAILYGTTPERMLRFWKNVDCQMSLMHSKKIPKKFRFDDIPEVKTQ